MATADRGPGPVGHLADQRIDEGIDEQGNCNRQADDICAHAHDLIEIIEQENRKAVILDPVSRGAKAIEYLGFERQLVRSHRQRRCSGRMPGISGFQLPWVPTSKPPSTSKCVPVTKPAASEAR